VSRLPGVFICPPKGKADGHQQALISGLAGAGKAATFLSQGRLEVAPITVSVDPSLCRYCGRCEAACGFGAIQVAPAPGRYLVAQVNEVRCTGCGACVAVCPSKAISPGLLTDEQVAASLEALLVRD